MDAEAYRELREMEQGITQQVITKGAFWGMQIGDSKQAVIEQLQRLGIQHVWPDVVPQIRVFAAKDLPRLRNADAVILFPGYVRVTFSGDQVRAIQVLPSVKPPWRARLEAAKMRDEVFAVFAEMLKHDKRLAAGNYSPAARGVNLAALSDSDRQLLVSHDAWEFGHDNAEGFWNLWLEFASERLYKIGVWHSLRETL